MHDVTIAISLKQQQEIDNADKNVHFDGMQILRTPACYVLIGKKTRFEE